MIQGSIAAGPEDQIYPAVPSHRYRKAAGHGSAEAETRESLRALHAQRGRATRVRAPQGGAVLLCGIAAELADRVAAPAIRDALTGKSARMPRPSADGCECERRLRRGTA